MPSTPSILAAWPIYVAWSSQLNCRGVFALRHIKKHEVVEVCPLILVDYQNSLDCQTRTPNHHLLDNYIYDWDKKRWCLPLGYGLLYNHSYQPNLIYRHASQHMLIKYVALIDIKKDTELTVNYNGDPADQTPIDSWFNEYSGRKFI